MINCTQKGSTSLFSAYECTLKLANGSYRRQERVPGKTFLNVLVSWQTRKRNQSDSAGLPAAGMNGLQRVYQSSQTIAPFMAYYIPLTLCPNYEYKAKDW